ncbi:transmembrane 9 superfamily member 7-like protein, partial [Tanacetum coccineum]
ILDNLPVAVLRQRRDESQSTTYEHGFRVGFKGNYAGSKEDKYFINDHLSFRVMYHEDLETDSARIVVFEVTPNSLMKCRSISRAGVGNSCVGAAASYCGVGKASAKQVEELEQQVKEL